MTPNPPSLLKVFLELIPLATFFLLYRSQGLMIATYGIVIATLCTLCVSYVLYRTLSYTVIFSGVLLMIMGIITVKSGDTRYIKMKPTIINGLFALILLGSSWLNKPVLRMAFNHSFTLSPQGWLQLSKRIGFFFAVMALLNEGVWRNLEEATWVKFKVFGMLPLTLLFVSLQLMRVLRHEANSPHP